MKVLFLPGTALYLLLCKPVYRYHGQALSKMNDTVTISITASVSASVPVHVHCSSNYQSSVINLLALLVVGSFNLGVLLKVFLFVRFWEPLHAGIAHHDVDGLLESPKDILLDVGNTVLLANGSNLGCRLLVAEHGKVGPHVMLDLVVEPSMPEVNRIRSHGKVDRGQDLTEVEGSGEWTARLAEAVHVVTGVVGNDNEEGVGIGQELSKK